MTIKYYLTHPVAGLVCVRDTFEEASRYAKEWIEECWEESQHSISRKEHDRKFEGMIIVSMEN